MHENDLRRTPLYSTHLALKARMVPFAGYLMPVQYTSLLEETKATRSGCGLFDVSHMGQFWVRGKAALTELQKVTTNDLTRLKVGQAQYSMLCSELGGVIDDIIVYRRELEDYFICVNASNRMKDWQWMSERLTGVTLTDESDATALIAIQGPTAEKLLGHFIDLIVLKDLKYYWGLEASFQDVPVFLSRTGYTGENGFELYVHADHCKALWDALLEKEATPCGLGARDTLRTEMGYPLHGHELSLEISPLEAGLAWVVRFNKDFIGKKALLTQKDNLRRSLIGLTMQDRRTARAGYAVESNGTAVGIVTSGTFSPHVNAPIALALVDSQFRDRSCFNVAIRNEKAVGKVTQLPFVPSRVKR